VAVKIGINGFGRIGRQVFKAIKERHAGEIEVVAINDLVDHKTNAHLLKYDSTYGKYPGTVEAGEGGIVVDGTPIAITAEREPGKIPWGDRGIEIVMEGTGFFTDANLARAHVHDTVKKVVISAPAKNEDGTFVLGVNADKYDPAKHQVISNASCTTNGLAPVVKVLVDTFGLIKGQMTTVHSYTNTQKLLDVQASDLRDARAAALNIVPSSTGAAKALRLVIPEVDGKLDGASYRVPTPTVSIVEVVAVVSKSTSVEEVNDAMRAAAADGPMKGILGVSDEPLVSMDFKGDTRSSIVDASVTNVVGGDLVKVAAWYDNEWGYSCRMSDMLAYVASKGS
jgi:glyceraldehyde 3-phosphate dehydrogenase